MRASPACPAARPRARGQLGRLAQAAGLGPVKVNCVLLRGFNDDQIVPFVEFARREGVILRFIEFMPLEEDRIWSPDTVIGYDELKARISAVRPLVPLPGNTPGRDGPALHLRRRHRRDRHHRTRLPAPSAAPAAACVSPRMARSAPASSPRWTTTFTASCGAVARMTIWLLISAK